jgi:hypothetical protein
MASRMHVPHLIWRHVAIAGFVECPQ